MVATEVTEITEGEGRVRGFKENIQYSTSMSKVQVWGGGTGGEGVIVAIAIAIEIGIGGVNF